MTYSSDTGNIWLGQLSHSLLGQLIDDGTHIYKMVKLLKAKTQDGPCGLKLEDGCYRVSPYINVGAEPVEGVYYYCDHTQTLPAGAIFWARCE